MKFACVNIFVCMAFYSSSARAFSTIFRRPTSIRNTCAAIASTQTTTAMSSTAIATDNPLLQQEDLPKFSKIGAKDLTPAVEMLLEKMETDFSSLESKLAAGDGALDYDDVLPEVERIQFGIGYVWGVAGHLNGVKNGDELRKAYEENQPKIVKAMSKFSQSKPLYDALSAVEKKWGDQQAADSFEMQQRRRAVENNLRAMTLGGVALEGEAKERFNEIKMRLASLSTTFSNNVLDETKAYSLTVDDPAKMECVPDSAKALWANSYEMKAKSDAAEGEVVPPMDAEKGPWRISLDMPSYIAVLSHMKDRSIREKVYKAQLTRASEFNEEKNNIPLVYEIIQLKTEMAKMLGFDTFAQMSMTKKMAPSVEAVNELSDLIADKALPAAERELAEITAMAREHGGDEYSEANLEKLAAWDTTFFSERLKETRFELKEEETRPYFALPKVLEGLFGLVERIFGIEVRAADGEVDVWHPDVGFYKVFDFSTGKHIASFFLDPYSRPEDKRGGAWMDVCIGKSEAVKRDVPVAYLTCNGSPPVGDTPSLMTFREVETLFHEAGEYNVVE